MEYFDDGMTGKLAKVFPPFSAKGEKRSQLTPCEAYFVAPENLETSILLLVRVPLRTEIGYV
jgi:hypothetical protein